MLTRIKKTLDIKKLLPYIFFTIAMIITISCKQSYHLDEVFTYGLANNTTGIGMDVKLAPYTYSPAVTAYADYMQADLSFDIAHIWSNQEADVHPPVYYCIVYFVSYLFHGSISRWIAGSINIVFMLLVLWISRKLLNELNCSVNFVSAFTCFMIFSAGMLAAISFFRMYILLMFEITLTTYLLVKFFGRENGKFYIALTLLTILGALTHYYYFVFLLFLSITYCIELLIDRKWFAVIKYVGSMGVAAVVSLIVFPGMLDHMFSESSDRGRESFQNLRAGWQEYFEGLKGYYDVFNKKLFGGFLSVIILFFVLTIIYVFSSKRHNKMTGDRNLLKRWCLVVIPPVCYYLLVSKIAVMLTSRYVVPIYALVLIFVLYGLYFILCSISENTQIGSIMYLFIVATVLIFSWRNSSWENLYLNEKEMNETLSEYSEVDCLYVSDAMNSKLFWDYVGVSKLKSVTYFENSVDELRNMESLSSQGEFILFTSDVDSEQTIQDIMDICPQIFSYEQIGSKRSSQIWHLSGDFSQVAEKKISKLAETTDVQTYLMELNNQSLSYCIYINEGSSLYKREDILQQIEVLSAHQELSCLREAQNGEINYFAVIDNGWQKCWEAIGQDSITDLGTTFGNLSYNQESGRPVCNILTADTNWLEFSQERCPDLQIIVINRYLGSVDEIAHFYVEGDSIIRE